MVKDFRSSVRELAATFAEQLAEQIIALVHTSSMAEVFGSTAPSAGRTKPAAPAAVAAPQRRPKRGRRPAANIGSTLTSIVGLLAKNKDGLRSEQIRDSLKIDKATATKALTAGLADKTLTKNGTRRATRYFAR